jgi:hypothetical protein
LYDAAYLAMTPARWTAAGAQVLFGNPFSPFSYTLGGRVLNASAEVFSDLATRRGKPRWNLAAEARVIDERPFGSLVRFERPRARPVPRVLLVAPLSGHYATLLRGTVAALLDDHDVYITDWHDAREIPPAAGRFDLDEYIAYTQDWIRLLGPEVHVVAVCQPVPAVLAAVALLAAAGDPAQPRSMVLMGGPLDVRVAPTAPTELAEQHSLAWFDRELTTRVPAWYRGAGRRVYPGYLQLGAFVAMHPERHFGGGRTARILRRVLERHGYSGRVLSADRRRRLSARRVDGRVDDVARCRRRPGSDSSHGAHDRRRRVRRHLGSGPDVRGARALQRYPRRAPRSFAPARRRSLRHLQRAHLPRHDRAPHRRVYRS